MTDSDTAFKMRHRAVEAAADHLLKLSAELIESAAADTYKQLPFMLTPGDEAVFRAQTALVTALRVLLPLTIKQIEASGAPKTRKADAFIHALAGSISQFTQDMPQAVRDEFIDRLIAKIEDANDFIADKLKKAQS